MASGEFLLDTHLLLWSAENPDKLPRKTRRLLEDSSNRILFSAVSVWEIGIKHSLQRADFTFEPELIRRSLLAADYEELPLTGLHAVTVASLPPIHRDPFDRILIAQALSEDLTLLTSDKIVARYPGRIVLI